MKRFDIGQQCNCSGLYGGTLEIEIVDRNDQFIFYHYTEECSDNSDQVHVAPIILQNVYDDIEHMNVVDKVETIEAWDYEGYKAYYWAGSNLVHKFEF